MEIHIHILHNNVFAVLTSGCLHDYIKTFFKSFSSLCSPFGTSTHYVQIFFNLWGANSGHFFGFYRSVKLGMRLIHAGHSQLIFQLDVGVLLRIFGCWLRFSRFAVCEPKRRFQADRAAYAAAPAPFGRCFGGSVHMRSNFQGGRWHYSVTSHVQRVVIF